MPAIKVYTANLGFYEVAVAARSRKMALAHWGLTRDLFREGAAHETKDPKAIEAAMRKVGMVVRRPLGSNGPFEEKKEAEATLLKSLARKSAGEKPKRAPAKKPPVKKTKRG
ncbi:MAG TPA: hypothetical protein VLV55_02425 [Rhizomicrobium sp.]|nr:hypothetical protein [Rhizomicrobium sp.]